MDVSPKSLATLYHCTRVVVPTLPMEVLVERYVSSLKVLPTARPLWLYYRLLLLGTLWVRTSLVCHNVQQVQFLPMQASLWHWRVISPNHPPGQASSKTASAAFSLTMYVGRTM